MERGGYGERAWRGGQCRERGVVVVQSAPALGHVPPLPWSPKAVPILKTPSLTRNHPFPRPPSQVRFLGENLQTYISKADEEEEADRRERVRRAQTNTAMALRVLASENQEDHEGRYYEFSTDITLGSSITNAVRVQGLEVSAVHARIEFRDGTPHLMDMSLDNAAGTCLQVLRPVVLRPRDVIILGATEFDIFGIRDCPSLRAPWLAAALRITRRRKSSRFGFVNRFKLPCHYTEVGRDEETTIGRDPGCDIVVRDFAMALRHAVVYYDRFDQTYCVESLVLSRKQGTFVLLGRRPATLPAGA